MPARMRLWFSPFAGVNGPFNPRSRSLAEIVPLERPSTSPIADWLSPSAQSLRRRASSSSVQPSAACCVSFQHEADVAHARSAATFGLPTPNHATALAPRQMSYSLLHHQSFAREIRPAWAWFTTSCANARDVPPSRIFSPFSGDGESVTRSVGITRNSLVSGTTVTWWCAATDRRAGPPLAVASRRRLAGPRPPRRRGSWAYMIMPDAERWVSHAARYEEEQGRVQPRQGEWISRRAERPARAG